jgi:hypothetical protein
VFYKFKVRNHYSHHFRLNSKFSTENFSIFTQTFVARVNLFIANNLGDLHTKKFGIWDETNILWTECGSVLQWPLSHIFWSPTQNHFCWNFYFKTEWSLFNRTNLKKIKFNFILDSTYSMSKFCHRQSTKFIAFFTQYWKSFKIKNLNSAWKLQVWSLSWDLN